MSVRQPPLLCVCSQFSSSRSLWSLWLKSVRQVCVSVISDGAYVKCRMVKICSQFSMCLIVISSPFKVVKTIHIMRKTVQCFHYLHIQEMYMRALSV